MKVRIDDPRFAREVTVCGGAHVDLALAFPGDAMYALTFSIVGREGDVFIARRSRIRAIMPPITPQADALRNPDARLPMMDDYGFSAALEAKQRRTEWAELREGRGGRRRSA